MILAQPMHSRHYAIRRRGFLQKGEVVQKKQRHDSIIWRNEGREALTVSFSNYEKYQGRYQGDEKGEV